MPKPEKIEKVSEIKALFESSSSFFIADYQGLNVTDITALRKNLRNQQTKIIVAKNTLIKKAAESAGVKGLDNHLTGPTAIAFCNGDPSVAAKILNDSYKEKSLPKMKAFTVDSELFDGKDIKRLADLPSKEVLLSQLISVIESPLTSLVGSIDGIFRKLIGTIDSLAQKKQAEGN